MASHAWLALTLLVSAQPPRHEDTTEPAPHAAHSQHDISDVVYGTGTNDEGLLVLLDAPVVGSVADGPVILEPPDQAALKERTVFSFRAQATAARSPVPRANARRSRFFSWLEDQLVLERSAHAHGDPMNGDAYLLTFSTHSQPRLLRVFTRETLFAPTVEQWQTLAAGSDPITLSLTRASFEEGRLAEGGGPFVSKPVHFSIDE